MAKNIFVLGLDEQNAHVLESLPDASHYRFHRLLNPDVLRTRDIKLPKLLAAAERQLYEFDGSIDAIIGYWDFPVSSLVPILCARFGTVGPTLNAVVKCEHKYWSRIEQQQVIEEHPRFDILDPFQATAPPPGFNYPFWIKPVKSVGSALAFHVKNAKQLDEALAKIRTGIEWMGAPFQSVLDHVDVPSGIAASGRACLVEEDVTGVQVTVEGYVHHGDVHVYGAVGSINYPDTSSFLRFQYPSAVPSHVINRMSGISARVIRQVELDNTTFNIEFFWNPGNDSVKLLEINPRHSQSHARMFQMVDGVPNHHAMIQLALGREPALPRGKGQYRIAAKWFLRRFSDATPTRVPSDEEVARLEQEIPGVAVHVVARAGQPLSDGGHHDSYSYELAEIFTGADSHPEMITTYERCVAALPFTFKPPAK